MHASRLLSCNRVIKAAAVGEEVRLLRDNLEANSVDNLRRESFRRWQRRR